MNNRKILFSYYYTRSKNLFSKMFFKNLTFFLKGLIALFGLPLLLPFFIPSFIIGFLLKILGVKKNIRDRINDFLIKITWIVIGVVLLLVVYQIYVLLSQIPQERIIKLIIYFATSPLLLLPLAVLFLVTRYETLKEMVREGPIEVRGEGYLHLGGNSYELKDLDIILAFDKKKMECEVTVENIKAKNVGIKKFLLPYGIGKEFEEALYKAGMKKLMTEEDANEAHSKSRKNGFVIVLGE